MTVPNLVYGFQLTDLQKKAVDMALVLKKERRNKPLVGILTGPAGTGKTTTLREIAGQLGDVLILAPTGKAALRVTEATGLAASTIHRWMYQPIEDGHGEIYFDLKLPEEIHCPSSGVIIVDEASMIDEVVWKELIEVCTKLECNILCVGDIFQLPPVFNSSFSVLDPRMVVHERVTLTEVMRQALDSPIIRASVLVREGRWQEAIKLLKVIEKKALYATTDDVVSSGGVAICHRNVTRHKLNQAMRQMRQLGNDAKPGEPILILKNCYEINRFNGEVITFNGWKDVTHSEVNISVKAEDVSDTKSKLGVAMLEGGDLAIIALNDLHGWMADIKHRDIRRAARNNVFRFHNVKEAEKLPVVQANFGYALTCHKSQGSEWGRVLVNVESSTDLSKEDGLRWLYTAITRAKEEVFIYVS